MKGVEEICGWKYYGICFVGGMLSSGATHLAITPLDVLKVNMQVGTTLLTSQHTQFISHRFHFFIGLSQ